METCIVLAVIIVVIIYIKQNKKQKENKNDCEINETSSPYIKNEKEIRYHEKDFLTYNEKNFMKILNELSNHNLFVFPQINLATVIKKESDFRYQNELYRNIDFGIFDNEYRLQLLIELNDPSHKSKKRYERDLKVRNVVSQAGIKLVTFYTNKPNESHYVINRILKEIEK